MIVGASCGLFDLCHDQTLYEMTTRVHLVFLSVFLVFILGVVCLFCQYHGQAIDWTDILHVEWDVKLCSLTQQLF